MGPTTSRPVVGDPHTAVRRERHVDGAGAARQDLAHGPVDDTQHEGVQPAFTGRADVHPGPLPDGFPALQHLDVSSVVLHAFRTHEDPSHGVRLITPA